MKRSNWTTEEKLGVVLEGLNQRKSVSETCARPLGICRDHGISQTIYYRWRDMFLEGARRGLENGGPDERAWRSEVERLQKLIGKQAIQIEILKKNGRAYEGASWTVSMLKDAGYTTVDACAALGVSRSRYYASLKSSGQPRRRHRLHDESLAGRIESLKLAHPFWGYRRVRAWLVYREGLAVNEKKVRRIMKEHGLMAHQTVHRAKRTSSRSKPRADKPLQYWGIDAAKFMVNGLGWVYLVIVLDWYTKKVAGWNLSVRNRTEERKRALDMAVNNEFPQGVRGKGLKLVSDNGSQPTSTSFMKDMSALGIEQIFTSYNNPKGNADTERMMRTVKEEVLWLEEFTSFEEAKERIDAWLRVDYNKLYVHSSLGYRSPEEFGALYSQQVLKEAV